MQVIDYLSPEEQERNKALMEQALIALEKRYGKVKPRPPVSRDDPDYQYQCEIHERRVYD